MPALSVLTHHSEPADPELLRWLIDTFEAFTDFGPATVVLPIAFGIVVFPALLGWLAWRARRRQAAGAEDDAGDGLRAK